MASLGHHSTKSPHIPLVHRAGSTSLSVVPSRPIRDQQSTSTRSATNVVYYLTTSLQTPTGALHSISNKSLHSDSDAWFPLPVPAGRGLQKGESISTLQRTRITSEHRTQNHTLQAELAWGGKAHTSEPKWQAHMAETWNSPRATETWQLLNQEGAWISFYSLWTNKKEIFFASVMKVQFALIILYW